MIIEGKKAKYIVEAINEIGDYRITIKGHESYEDGQTWMVGNFDYKSSIARIENGKKMLLKKSFKKLCAKHNMNLKQVSDRFNIPYRTVQNWASGQRECAEYIIDMIDEILTKENEKMKKFIVEMGWDVEAYETEAEAMASAEYGWSRLTEAEKKTTEYYRVYEIDRDIDDVKYDYTDYLVRMIKDYLNQEA